MSQIIVSQALVDGEARLVLQVDWAVRVQKCKIVSNDTDDTFVLLLDYASYFQDLGLQEMGKQPFVVYGTCEKRSMVPLHQAVHHLGSPLAKTLDQGTYIDWRWLHEQSGV